MQKNEWILFLDQLPQEGSLILFGNHRMVEVLIYHPEHDRIKKGELAYKDITHWCYIDPPPPVEEKSKWND
jgi:hypothetical protein